MEIKLSKIQTYFEKDILIHRKNNPSHHHHFAQGGGGGVVEDQFDALEAVSNEFSFGPFKWRLSLKPQPLLLPTMPPETSSWASPIRKALQNHRALNNMELVDLDQLGLSISIQRQPAKSILNNNKTPHHNQYNQG